MKNNLIVGGVILAIVLGGIGMFTPVGKTATQAVQKLGALAGPDIPSPYLQWGGVYQYNGVQTMQTATTTLCAIQGPTATSTVSFADFSVTTGTSTAATIDIGFGSTKYATSTNLVSAVSVGSGAKGAGVYTGSTANVVLPPSNYLIVKTAGAGVGGYTYTGTCAASFTVL